MSKRKEKAKFTEEEAELLVQQARKSVLDNVTHELLTPLTEIRSFAEILADDMVKDPQVQKTYYRKIIAESKRMEQMVYDLMELSRFQENTDVFEKNEVCATDIFGSVLTRYLLKTSNQETKLNIENLDLDNCPHLYTNAEKLIRLINVLLDHCVKFAGPGGTVSIDSKVELQRVMFCIRCKVACAIQMDPEKMFDGLYFPDNNGCSGVSRVEFAIADQIAEGLEERLWAERSADGELAFYFSVAHRAENKDEK